ncbi:MAG: flippase-like domain-containing protein [Deltaproteobacteria bacterium]|nr:flippase-like domain-containing protein [Deltaproteobacteria bacterium]
MSEAERVEQEKRESARTRFNKRQAAWLVLRLAVVAAILSYLFSVVQLRDLLEAFSRISFSAAVSAIGLGYSGLMICSIRWFVLFTVYGAENRPPLPRLFLLNLVGLFFNFFVPGSVGGDVVRGVATRDSFRQGGTTGAITVVLVERAAGMLGLLILATSAFSIHPLPGVGGGVRIWALIGLLLVVAVVFAVALARRYGGLFPGPIRRIALSLPEIRSPQSFIWALALSLISHAIVALAGHVLVSSMAPTVALADSMVVIPVAVGAAFFPLTVAGIGAREAAFIVLYAKVGVAEADALAASLSLLFCHMAVAASGGLVYLFYPLNQPKKP